MNATAADACLQPASMGWRLARFGRRPYLVVSAAAQLTRVRATAIDVILLLNGAFGIGKTSVARSLRRQSPKLRIVDPEWIGLGLQRSARLIGMGIDDFQDLRAWRTLTVRAIRLAARGGHSVVVPMAIDTAAYLAEIRGGLERGGLLCTHLCLVAPEHVVHERLAARGADRVRHAWEYRRASECCAAHSGPVFATHVNATLGSADAVATEVRRRWAAP